MTVPTPPAPTASPLAALPASPAASTRRANRPARPAMPGAAALPPLDALDRTHRQMVEVLADLTRLMVHLENNGVDAAARRTATGICSFFAGNARQHPADEETLVFPALIRTDDKLLIQHGCGCRKTTAGWRRTGLSCRRSCRPWPRVTAGTT